MVLVKIGIATLFHLRWDQTAGGQGSSWSTIQSRHLRSFVINAGACQVDAKASAYPDGLGWHSAYYSALIGRFHVGNGRRGILKDNREPSGR